MKFEEILVIAVFITGLIWLMDLFFLRKRRLEKSGEIKAGNSKVEAGNTKADNSNEPWYVEYSKSFFPVLIIVLILRSFLIEPFRIPSASMRPTLLEGDFIVVNKYNYGLRIPVLGNTLIKIGEPKRGDVVVFRHINNMDLIKRVIAIPGDKISFKDNAIYINGAQVPQEYVGEFLDTDASGTTWPVIKKIETVDNSLKHAIFNRVGTARSHYKFDDVTVPPGQYFVMGDNRDNSVDSRYWGFVEDKKLIGRAFATWLSFDFEKYNAIWERIFKFNKVVRWERVFKKIN